MSSLKVTIPAIDDIDILFRVREGLKSEECQENALMALADFFTMYLSPMHLDTFLRMFKYRLLEGDNHSSINRILEREEAAYGVYTRDGDMRIMTRRELDDELQDDNDMEERFNDEED
jgi:hypothetical protein